MELRDNMMVQETEKDGRIFVSMLLSLFPGNGVVGRYINDLKKQNKPLAFVEVESETLEGMLLRRGFTKRKETMTAHDLLTNKDLTTELELWVWEPNAQQ